MKLLLHIRMHIPEGTVGILNTRAMARKSFPSADSVYITSCALHTSSSPLPSPSPPSPSPTCTSHQVVTGIRRAADSFFYLATDTNVEAGAEIGGNLRSTENARRRAMGGSTSDGRSAECGACRRMRISVPGSSVGRMVRIAYISHESDNKGCDNEMKRSQNQISTLR